MSSNLVRGFAVLSGDSGNSDCGEPDRSAGRVLSGQGPSSSSSSSSSSASSSLSSYVSSSSDDDASLMGQDLVPLRERPGDELLIGDDLACANIVSKMNKILLKRLRKSGNAGGIELVIPKLVWRAHQPPVGYVIVYDEYFRAGLKLLISPVFVAVLDHFELALCQLTPNVLVVVLNFIDACEKLRVPCMLELFLYIFSFRSVGKGYAAIYAAKEVNYQKEGKKVPSHGYCKEIFYTLVVRM